jgi:hypothetical protein
MHRKTWFQTFVYLILMGFAGFSAMGMVIALMWLIAIRFIVG